MIDKLKEAREIISFQIFYSQKNIISTWFLAVIIILLFLIEEYMGGSTNVHVLVNMGANVRSLVARGEYGRIMSSVFLHAGFMHVFFNTYVLFVFGGFFNRILGEAKYLSVFFISGICGSLASLALGKAEVSVGASGAIWGLFGVSLALSLFSSDLIPETIRVNLRKITLINILINIAVSFLPMVDFWAHIGGGLGGFITSLLIIFPIHSFRLNYWRNRFFQILAFILASFYLCSIARFYYL